MLSPNKVAAPVAVGGDAKRVQSASADLGRLRAHLDMEVDMDNMSDLSDNE